MLKSFYACLALLAVGATWIGISAAKRVVGREMKLVSGRSTVSFFPTILEERGLKVNYKGTADPNFSSPEPSTGFKIEDADLEFRLVDARVYRFEGGAVQHHGGFKLTSKKGAIDADNFEIVSEEGIDKGLKLRTSPEHGAVVAFSLTNPRSLYDVKLNQLVVQGMDVYFTQAGAEALGEPELEGQLVGTMSLFAESEPIDGGGEVEAPEPEPAVASSTGLDLSISAMSSLSAVGRLGTYPNGRNGFTMSTTSCNVGDVQIPWNAPMQVTHPMIAMQLYRLKDGRFEQIGYSWMKHGFFATNSNGCVGGCVSAGTGSLLGVKCSDTYGTGNNSDRQYLGGRDEVNPFTGAWTCQNSYFSNYQNDCMRRRPTSGEFSSDPVAHRLEVWDVDLNVTGATYFYEAFYVNANETDTYNNVSSREATITWNGSAWAPSTTGNFVQGPAINRWGEMRSTANPNSQGDVIVAVQTTNLGNGKYHYEYAVYNHNLDRQIRTFSIPMPTNATVENIAFHDVDHDGTNDWASSVSNDAITWSTATFGSSSANPLKFASVFNFRFDCNVPPASTTSTLGLFKTGTGTELTAATRGPLVLRPVETEETLNGSIFGGNLQSLAKSDDDRLEIGQVITGARGGTGALCKITAPDGTITQFTVGVEFRNSLQASGNPTQTIELFNWNTGLWELIDTRACTQSDQVALVTISSNATRFINSTTRQVQIRIMHDSSLGVSGNRWVLGLDQVGVHFN